MAAMADDLRSAFDLAVRLIDAIVNIDDRTWRALWVGALYFGTFIIIGWAGRRILDRWMSGKGMSVKEQDRLPGELPRWRFLLGAWRRDE